MRRAGVQGWVWAVLSYSRAGIGERSCFCQPGRHTRVPQGSSQPAPVLLLGTKTLPPAWKPALQSLTSTTNYTTGSSQHEGPVPALPDVTLGPACAHFHSAQLLSTALWGGTDFSLLCLAAGTVSWRQACVRGAAALGSAQGLAANTSARGRFLPGEWSFSAQTEKPLKWLFRKR